MNNKLSILVSKRDLESSDGPYLKYENGTMCVWHGDRGYELRAGPDGMLLIDPVLDEDTGERPNIVLHPLKNCVGVKTIK